MKKSTLKKEYITRSAEETEKLAKQLVSGLQGGDVIALSGDLGSGKTTFVKGVAKALGIQDCIKSPTFNLLHVHQGRLMLYHFDFYRLSARDLKVLGFDEIIDTSDGIVMIEWAERIKEDIPPGAIWVEFQLQKENERKIKIHKIDRKKASLTRR